jgi:hypothetical protein
MPRRRSQSTSAPNLNASIEIAKIGPLGRECVGKAEDNGVFGAPTQQRSAQPTPLAKKPEAHSLADLGGYQAERAVNRLNVRCVSCVSIYLYVP